MRVFATHSWLEGDIVKGRLEAEGIPSDWRGEHEGPNPVGPAEPFGPSSFEAQARRVLEEIESGSYEVPDGAGDASA